MDIRFAMVVLGALSAGLAGYAFWMRGKYLAVQKKLEGVNRLVEREAILDEVTGLLNRKHLEAEIDREIERAKRYRHPLSVMMIDIDDFQSVNRRFGEPVGDRVLARVASVIHKGIRKIDVAGRYGADEFLVILPETSPESAKIVAGRIQEHVRAVRIEVPAPGISVTVSIGLFSFTDCEFLERKTFVDIADLAVMKAKKAGKNRIVSG